MAKKQFAMKLVCLVLALSMFVAMTTTAFASSTGETTGKIWAFYDGSFTKAWELYHSGDSGRASLTYGYNTFLIHEDYAWASHSTKSHHATIATVNGQYDGPTKNAGAVSKIEITHLAYEVFYFNLF